jgi:hypothetical protein
MPAIVREEDYLRLLEQEKENKERILVIPFTNLSNLDYSMSTEPLGDFDFLRVGETIKIISLYIDELSVDIEMMEHHLHIYFSHQRGAVFKKGERILGM